MIDIAELRSATLDPVVAEEIEAPPRLGIDDVGAPERFVHVLGERD